VYGEGSLAIGVARVGAKDQKMVVGTLKELCDVDLGPPLHSLVLLGSRRHELERDFIRPFAVDTRTFGESWRSAEG